jgi:hypothetical protein
VGDRGSVDVDVIVVIKIQELFSSELSAVVSDDGIRDPKTEDDVLDEIHDLLQADFSQEFHLNPLSELIDHDKQVGQAPEHLLERFQKVQAPYNKRPCNGDYLELLGQGVNLPSKVLATSAGSYGLCGIASSHRPVKSLPESLPDHAS